MLGCFLLHEMWKFVLARNRPEDGSSRLPIFVAPASSQPPQCERSGTMIPLPGRIFPCWRRSPGSFKI
jgi:hypothetical protein